MEKTGRSLGELLNQRGNNFDFIRFAMACLVIFMHSFMFTHGSDSVDREPLAWLTRQQIYTGSLAVSSFFFISGLLVSKSWDSSKNVWDYLLKRMLRIYPGYVGVLLFAACIAGPLCAGNISDYFHDKSVFIYVAKNLRLLGFYTDYLPGTFLKSVFPTHPNGSLWTIRPECICYLFVALLAIIRLQRNLIFLGICLVLAEYSFYYLEIAKHRVVFPPFLDPTALPRYMPYFIVGMIFYRLRDVISLSNRLFCVAAIASLISIGLNVAVYTLPLLLGYMIVVLAFHPKIILHSYSKRGDYSYGMYLYGWPVQQIIMRYFGNSMDTLTLFISSLCMTYVCAAGSWHLIEKPFLKLKSSGSRQQPMSQTNEQDSKIANTRE